MVSEDRFMRQRLVPRCKTRFRADMSWRHRTPSDELVKGWSSTGKLFQSELHDDWYGGSPPAIVPARHELKRSLVTRLFAHRDPIVVNLDKADERALGLYQALLSDDSASLRSVSGSDAGEQREKSDERLNARQNREDSRDATDSFLRHDIPFLSGFLSLGVFGAWLGSRDRNVYRRLGYGLIIAASIGIGAVAWGLL